MPRKKKSKVYFGKDVQDAIIRYNLSETQPRVAKHYIRTQAYWEWRKQI